MKQILIALGLLFVVASGYPQTTQQATPLTSIEFVQTLENGYLNCRQVNHSSSTDDLVLAKAAASSGLHVLTETIGRKQGTVGLDIVLRGTAQLESNPAAKQAFIDAAARWENIISSPIKVVIDVDYGTLRFGTAYSSSNILGSTSTPRVSATTVVGGGGTVVSIRRFADSLKSRNIGYSDLYDSIPNILANSAGTPAPYPSGGIPNMQAIGFYPAQMSESVGFGQTPNIGFNSAFPFDLDPSNGIGSGLYDFDGVAVHEMGHALGFVSIIGSDVSTLYTWDIFRFRPGAVTDLSTFKSATRVNTPGPSSSGGDQVFWDGIREWEVSTATGGQTGGDGNQASHWRDDGQRGSVPLSERKIGIMDPNSGAGERDTISLADKRALSIMGWKVDFHNLINAPTNLTVVSKDYKTPASASLSWKNPNTFYDGQALASWKIVVLRNGVTAKEFPAPTPNATLAFNDSGLTQYTTYTYRVMAVYTPTSDSGVVASQSVQVGGSPIAAVAGAVSTTSNGSTAIFKFTTPTVHVDGSTLHNLSGANIYRNSPTPVNLLDTFTFATTDTGKSYQYVNTPLPRAIPPSYTYYISFNTTSPSVIEGSPLGFPPVVAGKILTSTYIEHFETNRQSVVSTGLWDSTNTVAHGGTYSLAALSYPNNANYSAYLPQMKGSGSPTLSFWTICRTEAGNDFGLVEASRDHGQSWTTVLSLSEANHSEWQAGNNVWFPQNISLDAFATDTILVRFRLTSNGSVTKFGWLIDDIVLSPIVEAVQAEHLGMPSTYSLSQNYPNPFNPSTQISYGLKERGYVSLKIYDMLGREVKEVVSSLQGAGWYSVRFDADGMSSGVYFYTIRANGFVETQKMLLMK